MDANNVSTVPPGQPQLPHTADMIRYTADRRRLFETRRLRAGETLARDDLLILAKLQGYDFGTHGRLQHLEDHEHCTVWVQGNDPLPMAPQRMGTHRAEQNMAFSTQTSANRPMTGLPGHISPAPTSNGTYDALRAIGDPGMADTIRSLPNLQNRAPSRLRVTLPNPLPVDRRGSKQIAALVNERRNTPSPSPVGVELQPAPQLGPPRLSSYPTQAQRQDVHVRNLTPSPFSQTARDDGLQITRQPNLAVQVTETPRQVFQGRVYTTPPLHAGILEIPEQHLKLAEHQGYDVARDGQLLRLDDCPEGYAVWTGMNTYTDIGNQLVLKAHPTLTAHVQATLASVSPPQQLPQTQYGQPSHPPSPDTPAGRSTARDQEQYEEVWESMIISPFLRHAMQHQERPSQPRDGGNRPQ